MPLMSMLVFEGMWKTLELWNRKAVEQYKLALMDRPRMDLEDKAENIVNCGGFRREQYQQLG